MTTNLNVERKRKTKAFVGTIKTFIHTLQESPVSLPFVLQVSKITSNCTEVRFALASIMIQRGQGRENFAEQSSAAIGQGLIVSIHIYLSPAPLACLALKVLSRPT